MQIEGLWHWVSNILLTSTLTTTAGFHKSCRHLVGQCRWIHMSGRGAKTTLSDPGQREWRPMCPAADAAAATALHGWEILGPRSPHQHACALSPRRLVLTHVEVNKTDSLKLQDLMHCSGPPQNGGQRVLQVATAATRDMRTHPLDRLSDNEIVPPDQSLITVFQIWQSHQKLVRAHRRRERTLPRRTTRAAPRAAR